ncbi:cytochrome P450 [Fistulina hepatica ATCC 64428]|uniref:Cytochrome P450 n=1 Tax=Fistulina hepatica ATCC 64428 TaxID=1128425 RepID=A0A0D7A924_9AGAR|nr:cytochrome P450 [Fistulina hepatica ATCC 64428]
MLQQLILCAFLLIVPVVVWIGWRAKFSPLLPPGPSGDPFIGHARLLSSLAERDDVFQQLAHYGDIVHLHMPGISVVVVNSESVAMELLDRRGNIYSSRREAISLEMIGLEPNLAFLPYHAPLYNKHRRIFQKHFSREAIALYRPLVASRAHNLLKGFLARPHDYDAHILRFALIIPYKVGFGFDVGNDDETFQISLAALKVINDTPEQSLVDFVPVLRHFPSWLPGVSDVKRARKLRPLVRKIFDYPFEVLTKQFKVSTDGVAMETSVVGKEYELGTEAKEDPSELTFSLAGVGGTMIAAGVDTVWSTLTFGVIILAMNPEVQRNAQAELDNVLKGVRLPNFDDQSDLPYIDCIVMEIQRCVVPASANFFSATIPGIHHLSTEDDVYDGYFIREGTVVIPNVKVISRDGRVYKNPEYFNPARFLPKPYGGGEPPFTAGFGYGRRICPGRHLANAELFIAVASILAVFDIRPAVDSNGVEIKPELKMSSGFARHPKPVACDIRPRSPAFARLLQDSIH